MRSFAVLITVLASLYVLPSLFQVNAQQGPCPKGFEALCKFNPDPATGGNPNAYSNFFGGIILILLTIAIVVSLIFLVWGGIRWIKSSGDKGQIEQAKQTIIGAIIGLIISFVAFFFINVILGIFGLSTFNLDIPKLV